MAEQGGKELLIRKKYTKSVTFTDTGDVVGLADHGLAAGTPVTVVSVSAANGLTAGTVYYVLSPATSTFQLTATPTGSTPVAISADSTGIVSFILLVGGVRSKSFAINSEAIDVTNDDSSEWRNILNQAGIRSVSASVSGVFENGKVYNDLMQDILTNENAELDILTSKEGDKLAGMFKLTSLEQAGEYNGEMTYNMSFESAAEPTFTKAS